MESEQSIKAAMGGATGVRGARARSAAETLQLYILFGALHLSTPIPFFPVSQKNFTTTFNHVL
jgi:hypothetical protein